jgi:hypothetical protein
MRGLKAMGYRSEVAYTIRFTSDHDEKNKQSFYTFLAEAKSKAATAPCFAEQGWHEFEVDERRFRINFSAENVKWYESFEDVECHMALLDLAAEWANDESNNSEIGYKFVRVGEDDEDIEHKEGGEYDWGWVQVNRSIDRDW